MKQNEAIECLKKIALYKKEPLTQNEVDVLDYAIRCVEEHEKLKEALRKCSPYFHPDLPCTLCDAEYRVGDFKHAEDCEYLRLTSE